MTSLTIIMCGDWWKPLKESKKLKKRERRKSVNYEIRKKAKGRKKEIAKERMF